MEWESRFWPYQFFFVRFGLVRIGEEAVRVIELSLFDRQHDKRVPRTRVLEIGFREVRIAIGMRVEDADEIETALPGFGVRFQEILRPEHLIQGLRNRDLCRAIYPDVSAAPDSRRLAAGRVTRRLQLFRAHGLLFRVPKTNYYRLTKKGHDVMNTAIRFRNTDMALFAT